MTGSSDRFTNRELARIIADERAIREIAAEWKISASYVRYLKSERRRLFIEGIKTELGRATAAYTVSRTRENRKLLDRAQRAYDRYVKL